MPATWHSSHHSDFLGQNEGMIWQETLDQLGRENLSLKACVDEGREHLAEAKDEIEGFEKRLAEATVLLHQTQRAAQDRER